jgi:hypothetical protein
MRTELREIMVYQSPPELGALWTEVEEMMQIVGKEQSVVIAAEMQRNAAYKKIRAARLKRLRYRLACYSLTILTILYFTWLIWAVVQIRIEQEPELGRCLIPKGTWLYERYNNLKWIDCEVPINTKVVR